MPTDQSAYRAYCVCGRELTIPQSNLGRIMACPACQREVLPVAATPSIAPVSSAGSGSSAVVATTATATKLCPFCAEIILAAARKCRFCNEFLDQVSAPPARAAVPPAPVITPDDSPAVFKLCISQWDNLWKYLTCGLILLPAAGAFLLPAVRPYAMLILAGVAAADALAVLWIFLSTRSSRCFISPTRIETQTGILGKQIEWVSMASVTDIRLKQNLGHRLMGIGTIIISSSDQVTPMLELYQIPKARAAFEYLQTQISRYAQHQLHRY